MDWSKIENSTESVHAVIVGISKVKSNVNLLFGPILKLRKTDRGRYTHLSPQSVTNDFSLCDTFDLTHLPLVPHICVSGWCQHWFNNGLSPIRRQDIILTNTGILSIEHLKTNFSEILIKIQNLSSTKMHLQILSAKWWPFCPGGDELKVYSVFSRLEYLMIHMTRGHTSLRTRGTQSHKTPVDHNRWHKSMGLLMFIHDLYSPNLMRSDAMGCQASLSSRAT